MNLKLAMTYDHGEISELIEREEVLDIIKNAVGWEVGDFLRETRLKVICRLRDIRWLRVV